MNNISGFLHNELNGKVSVCEVYNGEKLADYLTKTADYKTYDLWYESFGRIRRRFSASKINGVSIISPKDKKNDDSLKDYEMIERMTFYGAVPKGVFPSSAFVCNEQRCGRRTYLLRKCYYSLCR